MENKYQLPKEFAEKWLKALRSSDYGQTTGELKKPYKNEYCCLGVACVIEGVKTFKGAGWIAETGVPKGIPYLLRGGSNENTFVDKVSTMNDTGKSFTEIADWIEANPELI